MLRVGTSGYSFPDWKGTVYPPEIVQRDMLTYYAYQLKFDTVEINYTYYRQPSARTLSAMARKVPEEFDFTIKAYKEMTHEIFDENWHIRDNTDVFKIYAEGIEPLTEEKRLGCVLFQFPTKFFPKRENKDYILACRERLPNIPMVIEFRNNAWVKKEGENWVFSFLEENDLGYCCVDEPDLPRLVPFVPKVTSPVAYFRFHGRNVNWFNVPASERYNYLYSDEELKPFVPVIEAAEEASKTAYVFFNNCHGGSAARNARRMKDLLGLVDDALDGPPEGKKEGPEQLGLFQET